MVAHQKFYFFDAGVFRILKPMGPLDSSQELDGAVLETLFLQSLFAVNDYFNLGYTIYFWRTVREPKSILFSTVLAASMRLKLNDQQTSIQKI